MLKFGAVDFDHGARIAEQNFGGGFDYASFSGTSWTEKKQIANGPSW
jgi:hypothetical protein